MVWDITEDGNRLDVMVEGRLVAAVAPDMREDIVARMKPGSKVVFDLSKMVHIDSSGLGVLVQILQKAHAEGGDVVIAGLQPGPKIVFDITKVSRVFKIVPTLDDVKFD